MFSALVMRSLARTRNLFIVLAALVALFQVLMVVVASSFETSRSFDTLIALAPAVVQRSLGSSLGVLATFTGMVMMAYLHPIVVLTVVQFAAFVATEPVGEVETWLVDLVLARPIARHWIVTRTLVVTFALTVALAVAMLLATWGGLMLLAPAGARWPAVSTVVSLAVHLVLVAWCFGALGLLAATFARRRGTAFAFVAVTAVCLYLLIAIADAWAPAAPFRWISPFHYFRGFAIIGGTAPTARNLFVLAVPTVALSALAYWRFARQDL